MSDQERSALILAAPSSGSGKTVITLAILRALTNASLSVGSFKAGPDYIDPKYHAAATGADCFNLDPWAMTAEQLDGVVTAGMKNKQYAIVEGVMGLFDGVIGGGGSTADLAASMDWPVILIIDCKGMSQSVGAILRGFMMQRSDVKIAGVVLNRVGSVKHERLLCSALSDLDCPVVGVIPRNVSLELPSRHLGLVQAEESEDINDFLEKAAWVIEQNLDLDLLLELAAGKIPKAENLSCWSKPGDVIAVAKDKAFAFSYAHVLEQWLVEGAQIEFFSPLNDEAPVSSADYIYLPGGYPELHGKTLARDGNWKSALKSAAKNDVPIYGECGGYMTLGERIFDREGVAHEMAGLLPITSSFAEPKLHLGYRKITGSLRESVRGHEFHFAETKENKSENSLYEARDSEDKELGSYGARVGTTSGSFLHLIAEH
jgi:cobyrinic acid a,c-diamide synthase